MIIAAINPYWDQSFGGFCILFFQRMWSFVTGNLPVSALASDEVQWLALVLTSFCCALLGAFLILRKMAMLANALSHTILLGIVLAFICFIPFGDAVPIGEQASILTLPGLMAASFLSGILTTFLTFVFQRWFHLQEDASIGLVFTTLFALGIVLVTVYTRNAHIGTEAVMGNIDAIHIDDLKLLLWIALGEFIIFGVLFKEFTASSFDAGFAKTLGISNFGIHMLLMVMVSAACIGAFRATGVLLVLAFLIGLPVTARLWTHHLKRMIVLAVGIGVVCGFFAVALARHFLSVHQVPLSTSGLAVVLIGIVFIASLLRFLVKKKLDRARVRGVIGKPS